MKRIRILIVHNVRVFGVLENLPNDLRWLAWPECSIESIPSTFHTRKLVVLNMHRSFFRQLGEGFMLKDCSYSKYIDFRDCEFLTETPDFSTIPNLERLNLVICPRKQ
ncbi:hypothetical protein OIU76_020056 [Salix suchowensis]|nr:hypothetical protein OIU76_020056 [Salix suchowensis]